ncbi:MAG: prolyl oligopeptidase family serine peptidase [Phycisphaerales bacterium]|nr:prolyl oligopeptidase family serine peptidase [Phycisphaerales bacterium]
MLTTIMLLTTLVASPLTPTTVHVTEDAREAWRRPVHTDDLEAWLVSGRPLTSKMMGAPRWQEAVQDDDGSVEIPRGGWGLFVFESDQETPAMLDASGMAEAWINGLPRGGDIYAAGHTRLPFLLKKGRNEVLFRSGRGHPAPVVRPAELLAKEEASPGAPRVALIGQSDRTLPDALAETPLDAYGGIIVYNVDTRPLEGAHMSASIEGHRVISPVPTIPPLSFLKVPVRLAAPPPGDESVECSLELHGPGSALLDEDTVTLRVRGDDQWRKNTFLSDVDGSVQYYGFVPAVGASDDPPGTVLSLHGASVEGGRQASCYRPRDWCMLVAPTNRRPFGFDWEEWGRIDALEAMADAQRRNPNDPSRAWLTGHSMGGHGTWSIGLTVPDKFAAIAPSAGWRSFWTYGGPERYEDDGGVRSLLRRAANPSDTELMLANADRFGIYVLHGDEDSTVPVSEARAMRAALGSGHADFAYYERPGAGHWWGDQCMDWPPLFEFLKGRTRGQAGHRDRLTFVTVDPSASSECDWAAIEQQHTSLAPSRIDLQIVREGDATTITGTTDNVSRLRIDAAHPDVAAEGPVTIAIDETKDVVLKGDGHLRQGADGRWGTAATIDAGEKNPQRGGRLRSAWNHDVVLVVGTTGTPEETRWNRARARQDAERWWYRGNGTVDIVDDQHFDPSVDVDRGVMLYGNADSNGAWTALLGTSPVQVDRGGVTVGDQTHTGSLAAVLVRPRPGSDTASVGTVTGTDAAGNRLAATLPLFLSGVGWPDWMVLEPSTLTNGEDGVVALGFFNHAWKLDPSQSAWGAGGE